MQPDFVKSILSCRYDERSSPWLKLMPVKIEEISRYPEILVFHDVMSNEELQILKDTTLPLVSYTG